MVSASLINPGPSGTIGASLISTWIRSGLIGASLIKTGLPGMIGAGPIKT